MTTGALIISTGSTSHNTAFSPMQMVGSLSAIQRLIMTFQLAEAEPVVLMVPEAQRAALEKHAARMGAVFLPSDVSGGQMFDSVCTGLRYLSGQCDQVLITPVDVPLFRVDTVRALVDSGKPLAVPQWDGRRGHPLLVSCQVIPSLLAYRGPDGLRGAVKTCGWELFPVEVPDWGVVLKAKDAEENPAMIQGHSLNRLRPVVKLQIASEVSFFGPGSRQLLGLIHTTGSVRLACEQMGLSYSKAWKMLNLLEAQLDFPVVIRKKGGRQGGETQLTPQGISLLLRYDCFEKECRDAVGKIFDRYFGEDAEPFAP